MQLQKDTLKLFEAATKLYEAATKLYEAVQGCTKQLQGAGAVTVAGEQIAVYAEVADPVFPVLLFQ